MMIICKVCDKPMICQPSHSYFKNKTMRDFYKETKDYVCSTCQEKTVEEFFEQGAEAVTLIHGRPAPWTPFGMEPDVKNFSRGKKEEDKMAKYELVFTSVATVVVEASSQKEADLMGAQYDVSKIDWTENVDFDYAEKLAGEEE